MRTVLVFLAVFIGFGFLLSEYIHMREDINIIKQQNAQLSKENENLIIERDYAVVNLTISKQKIAELTQNNQAQEEQIQQLTSENINLKDQNASLQNQAETLKFFRSFQLSLPKVFSLVILLPIIPASIAATYVFVHLNKNQTRPKNTKKARQQNVWVQLTEDEVKEIIRIRRMK